MNGFLFDEIERPRPGETSSFWLHMAIAFVFFFLYLSPVSAWAGLFVTPYICYMVFKPTRAHLLPLIIHTMNGSQQKYILLAACFLYALINFDKLRQAKLGWLFLLYLLMFPFFIWYTIQRYRAFGGGIGAGGTFEGLAYYFGMAPFFWAAVTIRSFGADFLKFMPVYMLLLEVVHILSGSYFSRVCIWGLTAVPVCLYWSFFTDQLKRKNTFRIFYGLGSLLYLASIAGACAKTVTFTNLGVSAIALMYLFLARKMKLLAKWLSPLYLLALSIFIVFAMMESFYDRTQDYRDVTYSDIKLRDMESLRMKLTKKAFSDRAPLWIGTWDSIKQQFEKDPIFVPPRAILGEVSYETRTVEVDLMGHNLVLEVLRQYGLWGGAGLFLTFTILFSLKRFRLVLIKESNTMYGLFLALCFGHAVSGSFSGQYVLTADFSFMLYSILGVIYGHDVLVCQMARKGGYR